MKQYNNLASIVALLFLWCSPVIAQVTPPITPAPEPPTAVPVAAPQFSLTGNDPTVVAKMQHLDQEMLLLRRQAEQVEAQARIANACRAADLNTVACQGLSGAGTNRASNLLQPTFAATSQKNGGAIVVQRITGTGGNLQAILLFPGGSALPVRTGALLPDGQRVVQIIPTAVVVRNQKTGKSSILGFSATAQSSQTHSEISPSLRSLN
jgi:type IV pilus biogenesis protein PilP